MIQTHGGNIYDCEVFFDFSANLNPLGIPEKVKDAVILSLNQCESYPDAFCRQLSNAVAEEEKIPFKNIVCGNGAADLIYRAVHAFRPKKAVICVPCFGEYRKALDEVNCSVTEYKLHEESNFVMCEDFSEELKSDIDMVFICTPNNPTGQLIYPEILKAVADKCLENDIILVCDECFIDFVSEKGHFSLRNFFYENCIILKAFTKIYAMAGLRLGYALCGSTGLAEKLRQSGQFWSVSVPAQKAGIAALKETEYVIRTVELVNRERDFLSEGLSAMGIKAYPSAANYVLFKAPVGLDDRLLDKGILIRNCSNYTGLCEGYYRIAVRTHKENQYFISALRRCLNG